MRLLCRYCIESFREPEDADRHVASAHPNEAKADKPGYWALCGGCDGRFESAADLTRHRDEAGH